MDERSIIRWQHRLKRERPTCTERTKSLTRVRMEGWRQWLTRPEKKTCPTKKQQNPLDSDRPSHGRAIRLFDPACPDAPETERRSESVKFPKKVHHNLNGRCNVLYSDVHAPDSLCAAAFSLGQAPALELSPSLPGNILRILRPSSPGVKGFRISDTS